MFLTELSEAGGHAGVFIDVGDKTEDRTSPSTYTEAEWCRCFMAACSSWSSCVPFTKFRVNIYRMLGHRREACPDKEICYLGLFNSVVVEMNAFKINRSI